jgi:hypothetical protein
MKKEIITSLLGLLTSVVTMYSSNAQTTTMLAHVSNNQETKLVSNVNSPNPITKAVALPLNEVSSKAVRSFVKTFKNVTNQQWYSLNGNKFLATFTSKDGRDSRALFANNGYIYYAISYGNEQSLRLDQRRLINSMYNDYSIGRVSEVSVVGQKIWVINLEDDNNIVIVRLTNDGILEELEHYQKHLPVKKQRKGGVVTP